MLFLKSVRYIMIGIYGEGYLSGCGLHGCGLALLFIRSFLLCICSHSSSVRGCVLERERGCLCGTLVTHIFLPILYFILCLHVPVQR